MLEKLIKIKVNDWKNINLNKDSDDSKLLQNINSKYNSIN